MSFPGGGSTVETVLPLLFYTRFTKKCVEC